MTSKIFAPALLSLIATAALVACGGGDGGGTAAAPPAPTADAVTTAASVAVAASIGATVIAGASSDEEVYNLTADVGDSWQLVLNNKTNQYVVKMLAPSLYNLSNTTPATFTKTTVGTVTTIKDASGTALSVQIDTRTKTVGGNITVGGKAAAVAGSGYVIADVGKLAGNYLFAGAVHNLDGTAPGTAVGSFIVAANGIDITACDGGIVVSGACAVVPGSNSTVVLTKQLKIVKDGALLRIKDGVKDFGILHVSAGDRGPVLIIDRFGIGDYNVFRTGAFFASKSTKLTGTEFNGNWTCSSRGNDIAVLAISGTSFTNTSKTTANQGTLQYNKVVNNANVAIDLDGVLIAKNNLEQLQDASLVLPLSSSLAIVVESQGQIDVCRKNS